MKYQRGGFGLGIVIGLLVGLGLALAVALYVTKVPVPFVDKVQQRTPEQDAAEAERNKSWDPNAPLAGKRAPVTPPPEPAAPPPPETGVAPLPQVPAPEAPPRGTATAPVTPPDAAASRVRPAPPATPPAARSTRDPAAILSGESATPPSVTMPAPSTTTRSTRSEADAFTYFVQVGAFGRVEDAEQQRARLAMLGYTARVTEREQSGRTVYRVRLGPFERKEEAEMTQDRLRGSTIESALVRVER